MPRYDEILHSYSEERPLTREEAVVLLQTPDEQLEALIEKAGVLRRKYKGNKVSVQLLTNVRSGNCSQDCAYCAQSCRSEADIEKYRSIPAEKLYADNNVVNEKHLARHCIGLSGISFTDGEIAELADRIRAMKQTGTHICCSIGFLTEKQARMLRDAGLDRINHNLNTSRRFYPNICSTHTYEQRIENLRMLKRVGFEICCGGIIGMGESEEDAADMLLDIREISPQSVPINFLLPIKGTLLAEQHPQADNGILHKGSVPCETYAAESGYSLCGRQRSVFRGTGGNAVRYRRFDIRRRLPYRRRSEYRRYTAAYRFTRI